jgi:hypothetical protein
MWDLDEKKKNPLRVVMYPNLDFQIFCNRHLPENISLGTFARRYIRPEDICPEDICPEIHLHGRIPGKCHRTARKLLLKYFNRFSEKSVFVLIMT